MTAAQIAGATSTPHWFDSKDLVDQVDASHRSWKPYMQATPGVGDTSEYAPVFTSDAGVSTTLKLYAQKHNPLPSLGAPPDEASIPSK